MNTDIIHESTISLSIYKSIFHDDDIINTNVIKEVEVVSNYYNRLSCSMPCVDILAKYVDRVDIKTGVHLIQYNDRRIKECNLEHLDSSFFTTRESYK